MTEEVVVETPAEVKVETPAAEVKVEAAPEPSPVESQARDQGWVSKEEWVELGRPEDDWRPAKEFVERGELYKSIHQTKRELKQTQAALDALQKHHQLVYEKAYTQALNELKTQKRQALREGDLEAAEQADEQIDQLREEHVKEREQLAAQQNVQVGPPPEFQAFLDRNPWYHTDKGMRDEADAAGFIYLNNGGDKATLLTHVEQVMKRKFPEKFGVKRAAPNAVAPTNRTAKPAPKGADVELDESEREAMRTFVRMGVMTEDQYKAEVKKLKGRS